MGLNHHKIRIGIDVGGTYTKCVAIDNDTHEIIGKNQVKTTHDAPEGVAEGVVQSFQNCMREHHISPSDIVFVAHSTTQATNAFVEGDVAQVGVIGVARAGLEGWLAKRQIHVDDILLDAKTGRTIKIYNFFIKAKDLTREAIDCAIADLSAKGAQVIVASKAFGVDNMQEEELIRDCAESQNIAVSMASDITKLYGLARRTKTAAINASILPKMIATANATEASIREVGITVPLMIMRGDGGVMDIQEMRKRPIQTALSGPAASVMGSLMYLRTSNAVYFEVGGTTTNIGVIKNGRPGIDYARISGHDTCVNSLDVRILGCAGGSMIRVNDKEIVDVGPRSAHIAGCEYACFTPESEIVEPQIVRVAPRAGDPCDYAVLRLKNGKNICITNTCAANVLGLVDQKYFACGNAAAARRAMQPLADQFGISVEQLAENILQKSYEKIAAVIRPLAEKYALELENIKFVGCGGGAAALVPFCAKKMNVSFDIPQNAEVISSIGVALAMVRDVVERVVPNPTQSDIQSIKKEAADAAIQSGAAAETVEVHIEIDSQSGKITAIATGSTEVKTTDLLKSCDEKEAFELACADMGPRVSNVHLKAQSDEFFVYQGTRGEKKLIRVVDRKGFVKVQCTNGKVVSSTIAQYREEIAALWQSQAIFKADSVLRPDFYICFGPRVADYQTVDLDQTLLLAEMDLGDRDPAEKIIIVAATVEV